MTEYETNAAFTKMLAAEVTRLRAVNAELRASTKNQVQVGTAQDPLNLNCKSTQARLATLWGYVKADAYVLEPSYTAVELAKMVLSDCAFSTDYTPLLARVSVRIEEFMECIEKAPQPARQPLTDEEIIALGDKARAAEGGDAGYILPISFARAVEKAHGIGGDA